MYRDPVSAVTDDSGDYQLAGLPSKEALLLAAAKEGFATASKEPEPDAEIVDFILGRGGRVEGRLCGSAADLALAEMVLDPAGVARQSTKPDASGLFTFDLVARGTWTIDRNWVFASPLSSGSMNWMSGAASERVTVEEGKTSTIMIGCDGVPVSGVALLDGRPLASHVGSLGREKAPEADVMTDSSGRFTTRVPGPGRYEARLMNTQSPGPNLMGAFCDVPASGTDLCVLGFAGASGK